MGMNDRTISLTLAVLAALSAHAELANPSFELTGNPARDDWPKAEGWETWGPWIRRETGWQPRHWGRCMIGYHHWRVVDPAPSGFSQDLPEFPPDTHVTFKVFAYRDADTNAEAVELRIEHVSGGTLLAACRYEVARMPAGVWNELSVSMKSPPASAAGLRVSVSISPAPRRPRGGALKFDDASLEIHPAGNRAGPRPPWSVPTVLEHARR